MNISFLTGNLTKEPQKVELDGKSLCKLTIAVNENFTKEDGTRPVQYFIVTVWNKVAENCLKYLKKGSKVSIVGKIQNRTWEDKDGTKRYAIEIVATEVEFLSTPKAKGLPEACEPVEDDTLPF